MVVCEMKIQLPYGSSLVLVFELKTQLKTYDPTHGSQFGLGMLRVYIATLEFGLLLMLTAMLCLEIRASVRLLCMWMIRFLITVVEHVCSEHM
jgi:hypothetical protein